MRIIITCCFLLSFLIGTSQDGAPGKEVRIQFCCRATSTCKTEEPLLVIDGVVEEFSALKHIDPNNIERIDILKSATLTAIYGCMASRGVIVITMKKITPIIPKNKTSESINSPGSLKVYPNPVLRTQAFTISSQTKTENAVTMNLLNLEGKVVQSEKFTKNTKQFTIRPDSRWAPGLYFIQLIDEKNKLLETGKLAIQ